VLINFVDQADAANHYTAPLYAAIPHKMFLAPKIPLPQYRDCMATCARMRRWVILSFRNTKAKFYTEQSFTPKFHTKQPV